MRRSVNADFGDLDRVEWAYEAVEDAVEDAFPPGDVVELLKCLADRAPSASALEYLGAGPLENLVRGAMDNAGRGSDQLANHIEKAARVSESFRRALAVVLPSDDDPDHIWSRLDRVLGTTVEERHPRRPLGDHRSH